MDIVLYALLGMYFGISILLVGMVKDEEGRSYSLRHPFGGMMIFLFGPIVSAAFILLPAFRQRARDAMKAKG